MKSVPKNGIWDFLQKIVEQKQWELEWVDLLSQMEYVGCRKILKATPYFAVDLNLLQHAAEEASHAFLLKRAAELSGLKKRSWQDGTFSQIGWEYFQNLDTQVSEQVEGIQSTYPVVSWAIERRVLAIYPCYLELTRLDAVRSALKTILLQEKRHAKQFEELVPESKLETVANIEHKLWTEAVYLLGSCLAKNDPLGCLKNGEQGR